MKRYIVTGASSGIGKSCAKRLIENGNQVIMVARNENLMRIAVKDNGNAVVIKEDLSKYGAGETVIEKLEELKLLPIDGLVHCAGIAPLKKIEENTIDLVTNAFETNVFSFVDMVEALKNRGGTAECVGCRNVFCYSR